MSFKFSSFRFLAATYVIIYCCFSFWLSGFTSPFIGYNSSLFSVLIVSLGLFILPYFDRKIFFIVWSLLLCVMVLCFKSRTGFLALATGLFVIFYLRSYKEKKISSFSGNVFILITTLSILTFFSVFLFKTDSTNGRWFIWQNCFSLLKKHWLTGCGWGQFRVAYNNQQAEWFLQHGFQQKQLLLADTVYYAFNEWLQLAVEIGVPLTLILFKTIIFLLIKAINKTKQSGNLQSQKIIAAFYAILFSTFFSYPFFYLPTLLLFVFLLLQVFFICQFSIVMKIPVKVLNTLSFLVFMLLVGIVALQGYSRNQWKEAAELQKFGFKKEALSKMKTAYPFLQNNSDYLYKLGEIFESLNKEDSALYFIEKSTKTKNDYFLHRKLGDLYFKKGNNTLAESHYLKAVYLVPNRFMSREKLVNFYYKTGSNEKAKYWASASLKIPVKINSSLVENIKNRFQAMLVSDVW